MVYSLGCHLMNSFEDSMHFYRLEEELFNSLQANNWNVGIHFVCIHNYSS